MISKFLKAPRFWSEKDSTLARYLKPVSDVYTAVASMRLNSVKPERLQIPVICVGNIVIGGSGKTPVVELVCNILKSNASKPHIISSGYGGYIKNVVMVDATMHTHLQVGDEPMMLSTVAPTWIGQNKANAGKAAELAGADVLVMDDGMQNNSLEKDLQVLVIDSLQWFGNEHVFPAGPLRESIRSGLKKADVVIIIGESDKALEETIWSNSPDVPVCHAKMHVKRHVNVPNNRVLGFCGLGYPSKFRNTLISEGYDLVDFVSFPDHHRYTISELQRLISTARNVDASLITTMKDYVKIPEVLRVNISILEISLRIDDDSFAILLKSSLFGKRAVAA
ncbi:MAG: tetraacyldisaccharide 4'-kinase [Holosporales bacterium]|jgi:tetraacyldisaccharide 4'-kinase|nr:tetraacyldisaccharide 4'-kinase [Holosporales bacterium]